MTAHHDPRRLARDLAEALRSMPEEVRLEVAGDMEPEVREHLVTSSMDGLEQALRRMARRRALGW